MPTLEIAAEKLAEWKELCEKATKGPWNAFLGDCESNPDDEDNPFQVGAAWIEEWFNHGLENGDGLSILKNEDARFIAAARTAMPALIAEVERLRKESNARIK